MSITRSNTAQQSLRHATADAHHTLDHHPLLQRLTGSALTREQYAESLAAMYPAHVAMERRVHDSQHYAEAGLTLSARRTLLEADLVELGWPVPAMMPKAPQLADGRAAWWGRLYVLEGSRQGGAVIARCIRTSLGDSVPYRFFADAMPADDRSTMMAMLEHALRDDAALQQAVTGARAAFAAYTAALDACDVGTPDVGRHAVESASFPVRIASRRART